MAFPKKKGGPFNPTPKGKRVRRKKTTFLSLKKKRKEKGDEFFGLPLMEGERGEASRSGKKMEGGRGQWNEACSRGLSQKERGGGDTKS